MQKRSQVWEDPQEGSSGEKNKCKGPEVRHSLGIVGTRPSYGKWEREEETHWRFVRGKEVEGFGDASGELGILFAFDGQSFERSEQGTGMIWLTLDI